MEAPSGLPPLVDFFPLTTVMLLCVLALFHQDALEDAVLDAKALLKVTSTLSLCGYLIVLFVFLVVLVRLGILAYNFLSSRSVKMQRERTLLVKERMALEIIFNTLGGSSKKWKKSTKWLTDAPLHEWHGVTLDHPTGHITKLILQENNLEGELPPEIADLTWLRELDLRDNNLSGELPLALFSMRALEGLYLYQNRFTGRIPDEIAHLKSTLRGVYLFNNNFDDIDHTKAVCAKHLHPDCLVYI